MSRTAFTADPRQGNYKKVLCVCYGNQLRSPTAALVLSSDPFNHNARSCGLDQNSAVTLVDNIMMEWADEIVVMEDFHRSTLVQMFRTEKPIKVLGIMDDYKYRDPTLMKLIAERYAT